MQEGTAAVPKPEDAQPGHTVVLPPDTGKPLWVMGDHITLKVTGKESGGAFVLWENTTPPGAGSPPHIHHREDEAFYILEGEYEFLGGGRTERVGPGTTVYVPRGTMHTFRNVGSVRARALAWVVPAGFEHFFEEVGEPATTVRTPPAPAGPPDLGHLMEVAQRYALEVRMPAA